MKDREGRMCVGAGQEYLLHFPSTLLSDVMMGQGRSKNWYERQAFEGEPEIRQEAVWELWEGMSMWEGHRLLCVKNVRGCG